MKVCIELLSGPYPYKQPTQESIQKNIDAIQRVIEGNTHVSDMVLLNDTKSILVAIQKHLPNEVY
jgi:hypothetical protein